MLAFFATWGPRVHLADFAPWNMRSVDTLSELMSSWMWKEREIELKYISQSIALMTLSAVTSVHIYINTNKLNKVKVG